jgi:hypothetical protein
MKSAGRPVVPYLRQSRLKEGTFSIDTDAVEPDIGRPGLPGQSKVRGVPTVRISVRAFEDRVGRSRARPMSSLPEGGK